MVCIEFILTAIRKKWNAKATIKDSETGAGVAGFKLVMGSLSGITDDTGSVTLGPFTRGSYDYLATHDDYEDISGTRAIPG